MLSTTKSAVLSRKISFRDHTIIGSATVPSSLLAWDTLLKNLETCLLDGLIEVLTSNSEPDWVHMRKLKYKNTIFTEGLVEYDCGMYAINYKYLILKGHLPFFFSIEKALYDNDRNAAFICVFPQR